MRPLALSILLIVALPASANFDDSTYPAGSLAATVSQLPPVAFETDWFINTASTKRRVTVTFTGSTRPIRKDHKQLIDRWAKSLRIDPMIAELFETEIEVQEADKTYWLPVQQQLMEPFRKEVVADSFVELYVLLLGGLKNDAIFAVNEFRSQRPSL